MCVQTIQPSRLAGARPAPKCAPITPQLCTLALSPPDGDDWLHEIKWDGFRMLCRIEDGDVLLTTRNGFDWTKRLGHIARAARALRCKNAILDGELVAAKSTLTGGLLVGTSASNRSRSPSRRKMATELEPKFTAATNRSSNCRTPRALPPAPPRPCVDNAWSS